MELHEFARLGDTIECEVSKPQRATLRVCLLTPEACAYGNRLLTDRASGWRLAPRVDEG